jgi:hypothetical protein
MRRIVAVLTVCLLFTAANVARAQAVTVQAPPDRFVAPGEFVTLVFRLSAAAASRCGSRRDVERLERRQPPRRRRARRLHGAHPSPSRSRSRATRRRSWSSA